VNVAFGRMRSRGRRPPPIAVADLEQASNQSSATDRPESPERALERREDQARVYAALEQLPPKKRIVLYLHEIEGRDLTEIAYLVDSNPVTVRTRLFYARREFYKILTGQAADGGDGGAP
jgi:RNA polymerase sigma-70 factor (ECF subfamily)